MDKEIKSSTDEKMQHSIESLKKDLLTVRTGRASTALLDNVFVDAYGASQKLNQCSTVSTPDAKTIMIQPWDPKLIGDIEKGIMKADLGLTPINDGKVVTSQPTEDLLRTLDSKELIITVDHDLTAVPEGLMDFNVELKNSRKLVFHVPPSQVPIESVLSAVRGCGLAISDLTTKESDLEDIFLMLTGDQETD